MTDVKGNMEEIPVFQSVHFNELYEVSVMHTTPREKLFYLENGAELVRPTLEQPERDDFSTASQYNDALIQYRSMRIVTHAFNYPGLLGSLGTTEAWRIKSAIMDQERAREESGPGGRQAFEAFKSKLVSTVRSRAAERARDLRRAIGSTGHQLWLVGASETDEHIPFAVELSSALAVPTDYGGEIVPIVKGKDAAEGRIPRGLRLETEPVHVITDTPSTHDPSKVIILPTGVPHQTPGQS